MHVQTTAANAARDMTKFVRTHFNLPNFSLLTRFSSSARRTRSWGGIKNGRGYISIQMRRYDPTRIGSGNAEYVEYRQIASHPTIGNFIGKPELCTIATVAHEVAHAVDHYTRSIEFNGRTQLESDSTQIGRCHEFKGHDRVWQYVYHVLRKEFVNKHLDPSAKRETTSVHEFVRTSPIYNKPVIIEPWGKPATPVIYSGSTNIAKVCNMYRANKDKNDSYLVNMIVTMLGVKRGNAKIYLAKARERIG
jgi:hypothetical protein